MHFAKQSMVSVNEGKKCLVKSGKDKAKKPEKRVLTYFTKYLNILCHLSLDTLPFMFRYFLGSVGIYMSEDLR